MPRTATPFRTAPPLWTPPPAGTIFLRGARPSPPHKLLAAHPFLALAAAPPEFGIVPAQLNMWGNNQYGDCVSAEEAFAKACNNPEIFIPEQTVIDWARQGGFLNGADLSEVCDAMAKSGFRVGNQLYCDGPKQGVDYSNELVLQAAIAEGPVKIAIDASALSKGAGNQQGWYSFGKGNFRNTDHCTGLSGYGTAGYCFKMLGVPLPSGVDANKPSCYLHFTWSTIGVVDHDWLMGTCTEAWVRQPTTVGVPPLPQPPIDPNLWS